MLCICWIKKYIYIYIYTHTYIYIYTVKMKVRMPARIPNIPPPQLECGPRTAKNPSVRMPPHPGFKFFCFWRTLCTNPSLRMPTHCIYIYICCIYIIHIYIYNIYIIGCSCFLCLMSKRSGRRLGTTQLGWCNLVVSHPAKAS